MKQSSNNIILVVVAISGFLWVLIAAMTGHKPLSAPYASYLVKAQNYQIIHTLVCMFLTLKVMNIRRLITIIAFFLGIVCFSGSLYFMAIYHWPLNMIVPIGGVSFLIGWLVMTYDAIKEGQKYI